MIDPSGFEAAKGSIEEFMKKLEDKQARAAAAAARAEAFKEGGFMGLLSYVSGGTTGTATAASAAADGAQGGKGAKTDKLDGAAITKSLNSSVKTDIAPGTEAEKGKGPRNRVKVLLAENETDESLVEETEVLLEVLRTYTIDGQLTKAGQYLHWLENESGVDVTIYATARGGNGAHPINFMYDECSFSNDGGGRFSEGIGLSSEMSFNPRARSLENSRHPLAALAHELTHSYMFGRGRYANSFAGEFEPIRVQNQILNALYSQGKSAGMLIDRHSPGEPLVKSPYLYCNEMPGNDPRYLSWNNGDILGVMGWPGIK